VEGEAVTGIARPRCRTAAAAVEGAAGEGRRRRGRRGGAVAVAVRKVAPTAKAPLRANSQSEIDFRRRGRARNPRAKCVPLAPRSFGRNERTGIRLLEFACR
jgi:hypothetical protein